MRELTILLDADKKTPLYEQIYEYIRSEIRSGRMECGVKLPSARALAGGLQVSRSTVDLAYAKLRDDEAGGGWLLGGVNNTEKSRKIRLFWGDSLS